MLRDLLENFTDKVRSLELFRISIFNLALWQWILLLLMLLASGVVAFLLAKCIAFIGARLIHQKNDRIRKLFKQRLSGPLIIFLAATIFAFLVKIPKPSLVFSEVAFSITSFLFYVALGWAVYSLADFFLTKEVLKKDQKYARMAPLLPLIRKAVKILVVLFTLLLMLHNAGINVSSLLVGLGVGGVAVALAAQKIIENLFGGVVLALDRPVQVGDLCKFDETTGTIEEIGLRSTRVRTADRTLISVPNGDFSQMKIENFGPREKIRFYMVLKLRYGITSNQIRWLLLEIRQTLFAHPAVHKDPSRARLIGFSDTGIEIEIAAYLKTTVTSDFLAIREDLLFLLYDLVEQVGAAFAVQMNTNITEPSPEQRHEKAALADKTIKERIENHTLFFPDFSEQAYRDIKNTGHYPPLGAPASAPINYSSED